MKDFRCKKCNQLQFKWKFDGVKITVEVKCYACNTYNYFTINLVSLLKGNVNKKHDKNNKQLS